MSQYKLATYQSPQGPRAGLVIDDTIFDLAAATGRPSYATMLDVLRDWDAARVLLQDAAKTSSDKTSSNKTSSNKTSSNTAAGKKTEGRPLRSTKLLAPVPTPGGI